VDTMASEKVAKRRRYGAELKAQVVASVMRLVRRWKVAMAHGINANIVHGWRKRGGRARGAPRVRRTASAPMEAPRLSGTHCSR